MSSNIYDLTPLNLALDGSLDIFYDLYQTAYDICLKKIANNPALIHSRDRLNDALLAHIIDGANVLLSNSLHIFTERVNSIHLKRKHFKYFSFIDEEKVAKFAWELNTRHEYEEKYGHDSILTSMWPEEDPTGFVEFQKTAISFEQFLAEFQRSVTRAIRDIIQQDDPNYTIFTARKDVETHIRQRMMKKRDECILPRAICTQPTAEPLYVFDALKNIACKRNNHRIVIKKYYALHSDGQHTVALPVHYCADCNRYMIGRLSFSLFRDFCGSFITQTYQLVSDHDHEWNMLRESKLHQLGYNVVEGKMSAFERQNLLVTLLETKYISFFDMISTIEQNIRMFQGHYKMQNAVRKWQEDLKYINEYVASR